MMDWGSGTFAVGQHRLEYATWGPSPAEAPTLVLLHEGLGSLGLWRDWPAQLAERTGKGVLAFSRAGYGRSTPVNLPRPLDYMTLEATEVLRPVLDAAGVRACLLLGHSDGATIAGIYAGSVSDMRVRGLILMAPHFFTEPEGLAAIRAAGGAYAGGDLKEKLTRHHDHPDIAFYGWHDAWMDPGFVDWNVADAIDHWRVPSLVIQGAADPYGTLAQVHEVEERAYAPVETLILEGCGHAPHKERQEEVTAEIAAFCARLQAFETSDVEIPEFT
ncbi:alpha/beta fold hydrolase [Tateyamaria sp. Alg231-49]|uniref:alpha/beta fold hydrolase n=1 Tax=Tateyamaria sp. Alg231-49 TaxID=1922219 RepID=UPI000D55381F|nr:alpha/beta hydrolase [Tateyamaria sp. Alg231-49]